MRFTHMGDCHLGGWRIPELQKLNFEYFKHVIEKSIDEKVDFILIAGDLFDSAYPPIDTIKKTFNELRKLKEAKIPMFFIAGSHDYSVTGKSFLDVIEKAGFGKNVYKFEERNNQIILNPTIFKGAAIYGYPGKKSGYEVREIPGLKLEDAPGLFRILMLHTTLREAIGTIPIEAVEMSQLPNVEYVAMAHLHTKFEKNNIIYCGPTFPNNLSELEDLGGGSFYIIDTDGKSKRHEIRLKEIITIEEEITDAYTAKEKILKRLQKEDIVDKILILKLKGILESGKTSDIDFTSIRNLVIKKKVYAFLKHTRGLKSQDITITSDLGTEELEAKIIEDYVRMNPHVYNHLIQSLNSTFKIEKKEDETTKVFEDRLFSDAIRIINL